MTPQQLAFSRFFLGIAQASHERRRDTETMPFFTLPMILEAEGTLAAGVAEKLLPTVGRAK